MKVVLINPPWSFERSIYFGCREPHLPLELGYTKALLEREGHDVALLDGQLGGLSLDAIAERVSEIRPDMTVVTTAPSYLFWRCAPPELRVPIELARRIRKHAGALIGVGPHASTTPKSTLRKLSADAVVLGECEEVVVTLAATPESHWAAVDGVTLEEGGEVRVNGRVHASDMAKLPALRWSREDVSRHSHHHHRFDAEPAGPGAELEASRGCPYHCTFCAKENFRNGYRKRPLATVLEELDGLLEQGVRYVYFIDEIFLPDRPLLEALAERHVTFGCQLRIDNWSKEMLELLGQAGCVSIEAGVESITPEGRSLLHKKTKLSTDQLSELLLHAKKFVPFVQANLIDGKTDHPADVAAWRRRMKDHGVWANEPVPLFPYPGSPDYTLRWGAPDDTAWERAHAHYLAQFSHFSDIQDERPAQLAELEGGVFSCA